jgi:ABC-type multidrug transport system fused ATPase/permease subunit
MNKMGILQTQFSLFSTRNLLLGFWSMIPLFFLFDIPFLFRTESNPVFLFTANATIFLVVLLDVTVPSCLAYFFHCNPNIGAELTILPPPKRISFFILSTIVGILNGSFIIYDVASEKESAEMFIPHAYLVILLIICVVFDIITRICLSQVVGSVTERFHRRIQQLTLFYAKMIPSSEENPLAVQCESAETGSIMVHSIMESLEEYRNIHKGLGPLLLLSISANTTLFITNIFVTITVSELIPSLANSLYSLGTLLHVFYLIQVCDDCRGDIKQMKELIR